MMIEKTDVEGMLISTFWAIPLGEPRYEKYASIGIKTRKTVTPQILSVLTFPDFFFNDGLTSFYAINTHSYLIHRNLRRRNYILKRMQVRPWNWRELLWKEEEEQKHQYEHHKLSIHKSTEWRRRLEERRYWRMKRIQEVYE